MDGDEYTSADVQEQRKLYIHYDNASSYGYPMDMEYNYYYDYTMPPVTFSELMLYEEPSMGIPLSHDRYDPWTGELYYMTVMMDWSGSEVLGYVTRVDTMEYMTEYSDISDIINDDTPAEPDPYSYQFYIEERTNY